MLVFPCRAPVTSYSFSICQDVSYNFMENETSRRHALADVEEISALAGLSYMAFPNGNMNSI